ncbi:MAG: hypothetical protein E7371_02735 [Clostridiales bacterium]|nr:hypothetical protein [Clostridiales bacterium]
MKRNNKKLLTIMLAGMLCSATIGAAAAIAPVNASAATAQTYALTDIFKGAGEVTADGEGEARKTVFTLDNDESVTYSRNLAIEWFTKDGAQYTTLSFSFKELNFTSVSFTFNSLPMHATKDDVAVNTVKFTVSEGKLYAKVIADGEEDEVTENGTEITDTSAITLKLGKASEAGNYTVSINDVSLDEFTNIGAKYFRTSTVADDEMNSLEIKAETEASAQAVVYLSNINGQTFEGVSADNKVTDKVAPVLVVNEDVGEFLLGTRFQLDYTFIDVLDSTISTTNASKYYQYNPAKTEVTKDDYTTLQIKDNGTYFMESTAYYNKTEDKWVTEKTDGYTLTTVYRELKNEYVSIKFTPKDDTFIESEGEFATPEYDLAWYATTSESFGDIAYLVFNRNTTGPNYKAYKTEEVEAYQASLDKLAGKVSGGSGAELELPSLNWLIEDANNGYDSLKFTISYKTQSSSSPTTKTASKPSDMKIPASEPGQYEFKVFANDAAGNPIYAKDNEGVDVKVTTDNIWDLDSIPSFTYTIKAKGIKAENTTAGNKVDNKHIGENYTMTVVDVEGLVGSLGSAYQLYIVDLDAYDGKNENDLTLDTLKGISYDKLKTEAEKLIEAELKKEGASADKIDYAAINRTAYANLLVSAIKGEEADKAKMLAIFKEVAAYDDRITEDMTSAWDESDNEYKWKPDSRSFTAATDDIYLIMADYWDTDMKYVDHVPAFKLVEVESAKDIIKGETEWLKNNIVSVILFAIAGVMLILIIILLLVKPSEETLEDVDEEVIAKRKQATDKNKKN